jgi:diacylglycerol kinase (ATP)
MPPDSVLPAAVVIIANPRAGTTSRELIADVATRCSSRVRDTTVHWTTAPGDATTVARGAAAEPGAASNLVLAAGGDGTVREVVQGLIAGAPPDGGPALMIVPAGTGNSNYLAQWGDLPWPKALGLALGERPADGIRARTRRLDLCRLRETGDLVMLGACSGLIAEALLVAPHIPLTGRARYQEALARAADTHQPYAGRVMVDGATVHEGPTVLANVGGGRHRGGTYQVLPHSLLDDGYLDVCVIGAETPARRVPELTVDARHIGEPGVVYARGRRITVESTDRRPFCFEHDGELVPGGLSSFTLEVLPGALPVLCRVGRDGG